MSLANFTGFETKKVEVREERAQCFCPVLCLINGL